MSEHYCERCGGTAEIPRHGLLVCSTCLHVRQEVRLMASRPIPAPPALPKRGDA